MVGWERIKMKIAKLIYHLVYLLVQLLLPHLSSPFSFYYYLIPLSFTSISSHFDHLLIYISFSHSSFFFLFFLISLSHVTFFFFYLMSVSLFYSLFSFSSSIISHFTFLLILLFLFNSIPSHCLRHHFLSHFTISFTFSHPNFSLCNWIMLLFITFSLLPLFISSIPTHRIFTLLFYFLSS